MFNETAAEQSFGLGSIQERSRSRLGQSRTQTSPWIPKPTTLPRDGPQPGGGVLSVRDRGLYEGQVREAITPEEAPAPAGLTDKRKHGRRPSATSTSGTRTGSAGADAGGGLGPGSKSAKARGSSKARGGENATDSPRSASAAGARPGGAQRLGPEERRAQEMFHKWEKAEAVRTRDHKNIVERIDRSKEMRENRYKRLIASVHGQGTLAYETAVDLREREEREDVRRRELYNEWEEKIFQPMASQSHSHMNPPDRKKEQELAGEKSVEWSLPGDEFKLIHKVRQCPARRPVVEHAREHAFHQAAEFVLRKSSSAPVIQKAQASLMPMGAAATAAASAAASAKAAVAAAAKAARDVDQPPPARALSAHEIPGLFGHGGDEAVPRARSKTILNPTDWSQVTLQGTLYGHFAQKMEHGVGFLKCIRAGPDAHLPDEADGVPAAGTRASRTAGFHDKGILVGDRAVRGEASQHKMLHGASCAAPCQDHFTFEAGRHITDLEFPLGKRPPPAGTLR